MRDATDLERLLDRIDGRSYPAYRDIKGPWAVGEGVELHVDHVQGDPFASPSLVRVRVAADAAGFPGDLFASRVRRVALEDWVARGLRKRLGRERRNGGAAESDATSENRGRRGFGRGGGDRSGGSGGSGKSGLISIDAGGQEVIERSAVKLTPDWVEARLRVGLPARGRRILGREARRLLVDQLGGPVAGGLHWGELDQDAGTRFVETVENWAAIQGQLGDLGLVAFVPDGAVLPRASGVDDGPMRGGGVVEFESPDELRVTINVPNPVDGSRELAGMGVPRGVTLVVGGGYHGKSTLLRALERGVYPHVPGDGRELVATDAAAVKIRAEDGRRVEGVDISPFIRDLPFGRSTGSFSTDDASGSTSQAASIVEALEAGARVLLLDEDTSATNFMVRDARMQALVHRDDEPITPFVDRVRELWESHGVSTVLVMGGCGDYFEAADRVVAMRDYRARDVTGDAKQIAAASPSGREREVSGALVLEAARAPARGCIDASKGKRAAKIDARGTRQLSFGHETVELGAVEQLVDPSQVRLLGCALHRTGGRLADGTASFGEILDALEAELDAGGPDALAERGPPGEHPGELARARRFEIAAALNRLRTLRVG